MHFRHMYVTKSFASWNGHNTNMTTHTPISEANIDSSSSIRNHDTNYSTHKKTRSQGNMVLRKRFRALTTIGFQHAVSKSSCGRHYVICQLLIPAHQPVRMFRSGGRPYWRTPELLWDKGTPLNAFPASVCDEILCFMARSSSQYDYTFKAQPPFRSSVRSSQHLRDII